MTVLDFVRLTRANLLLLLGLGMLGLVGAYGYSQTLPVVYAAEATGTVIAGTSVSVGDAAAGLSLAQMKAASYVPLVNGRGVGERVVRELGYGTPGGVAASLSASVPEGATIFRVVARSGTPEGAARLANAAMKATAAEALSIETANNPAGTEGQSVVRLLPTDDALPPGSSISPNVRRNLLAGGVAGLVLGYGVALLRRQLDSRIRHVDDVEQTANTSVIGVIPRVAEIAEQRRTGLGGDLGPATEAFRHLRTNLRFVDIDRRPRSIVVTSANPGEGKSSVSSNLARVLAESGQPTVIVDADLRRPVLARLFQADGSLGLTQVLAGDLELKVALQETATPGLTFLPAGRIPPNPSELLGSQRMRAVVEELTKDHYVILDAPPLLPVTDGGLLTAVADGAVLAIAVGRSRKEELTLCTKILAQVGGRLLGTVMNLAPRRGLGSVYYGYGYATKSYRYQSEDRQRWGRGAVPRWRGRS